MSLPLKCCAAAALWTMLIMSASGADQPANERIPVILDCDIGTDIDDTFALALAIISRSCNCGASPPSAATRASGR